MTVPVLEQGGTEPPAPDEEGGEGGKPMTFWEHLEELRVAPHSQRGRAVRRVPRRVGGARADPRGAQDPVRRRVARGQPGGRRRRSTSRRRPAAFTAYVKLSLIGGAALAAPVVFYQLWAFVAPGLYAKEKKYVIPFVGISSILFIGGGWFGWRVAIPLSFRYFLGQAADPGAPITPTIMVGDYIDFCLQVMLGFGLTFRAADAAALPRPSPASSTTSRSSGTAATSSSSRS